MKNKRILLIISGGIAAYKSLELIRLLKKSGASVGCILTKGGEQFITPLSVASLSGQQCYTDLFSLKDETEMGHIQLSRDADLLVVAPASADLLARMAQGRSDDLAATTILATDKPVLVAPAMNVRMWNHAATQDNMIRLEQRGILRVGPDDGEMACGEYGPGRMAEPEDILAAIEKHFAQNKPLAGKSALVTSGPTHEPIDPVRFIGNRSSGKQGHAIAIALADLGADVTLVTGPVALPDPLGIKTVHIETAAEMLAACNASLPADIAVCAAAVADWTPGKPLDQKIKKRGDKSPPDLKLIENPDILATLSKGPNRPSLVIGFAAETENLMDAAKSKLKSKGCDWIVANDVSEGVFGADENTVTLVTSAGAEEWEKAGKQDIAHKLAQRIAAHISQPQHTPRLKSVLS
ncbi:MAG: bifunctional phosphopantothenoylcysteine decarboxylase/phosphopantothenate synthase [Micavibrio sp.]|nr:bifunctional phosphopantothenoylcysteine decarboxylase/phosphopantothenate synthase [Micavibrio sp.]